VVDVELHDEVVNWLAGLTDEEWDRAVIVIDRLASLGSRARMPLSRSLGEGLFELRFALGPTARRITLPVHEHRSDRAANDVRKQRNNERAEIARTRKIADECARRYP
jgi:putative component of toxin-antitoxin plasmid stabilization module